jgi:hypothetical protein
MKMATTDKATTGRPPVVVVGALDETCDGGQRSDAAEVEHTGEMLRDS